MRNYLITTLLLAGSLALPWSGTAQEIVVTVQAPGGWIGVTLDFRSATIQGLEHAGARVREVIPGSPAEAAGVRVGDTLTHIDGEPASQGTLDRLRQRLDPGDVVRLRVLRDGRSRDILVEAAPWPGDPSVLVLSRSEGDREAGLREVVVRLDSVRGTILQNLDSVALTIRHLRYDSLPGAGWSVFRSPGGAQGTAVWSAPTMELHFDSLHLSPEVFFMGPEAAFPFETFETLVVRSPATDSIRSTIERVSRSLAEVRRGEIARLRELERTAISEETALRDARIQELRARETALREELQRQQERLRQVSEEEMKRRWAEGQARSQTLWDRDHLRVEGDSLRQLQERRVREEEIYTPGRILAMGQSFVLGAQLQAMNRELAEYFPVDRGLLVTQVVEGTPAAGAGLRGGDIIVAAGGEPVSSMDDLRLFLGYARGPLQVEVVRKGERLVLEIRR